MTRAITHAIKHGKKTIFGPHFMNIDIHAPAFIGNSVPRCNIEATSFSIGQEHIMATG